MLRAFGAGWLLFPFRPFERDFQAREADRARAPMPTEENFMPFHMSYLMCL